MSGAGHAWLLAPILQGIVALADELVFHRRRARQGRFPLWERLGHPIDTLSLAACIAIATFQPPSAGSLRAFAISGAFSCLLVTKDERVHARLCGAAEHWLHSLLFILHPLAIVGHGILWAGAGSRLLDSRIGSFVAGELAVAISYAIYQAVYWNFLRADGVARAGLRRGPARRRKAADNTIYAGFGDSWYSADDHPAALLRAESRLRNPWVLANLQEGPERACRVLDLGCGAGFLSNALAERGHRVVGVDLSPEALEVARARDRTASVEYQVADATRLAFEDGAFDAVCAMDLLEHVEDPAAVVREAARVLRPGGRFFFHTFDRNPASGLLAILAVRAFVRNTPRRLHVYRMFVRPRELRRMCEGSRLLVRQLRGVNPALSGALLRLAARRRVPPEFRFRFSRRILSGYCGFAEKRPGARAPLSAARPARPTARRASPS